MRSLVVLFALIAVGMAAPKPQYAVSYTVPSAVTNYGVPVVTEQVVASPAYSPVATVYSAPSAVSHQSRVDYQSPVYGTRSVYAPSVYTPSVYNPSVYAPSVYTPSVYAPYW